MFARRVRLLTATFWAGSLWTIGYVVAPSLFATLSDRVLAGSIAGTLFRTEAWISLACAVILLVLRTRMNGVTSMAPEGSVAEDARRARHFMLIVIAMAMCTLVGYFGTQPFMAELRAGAGPGGVMESAARSRFGLLHGISSAFYLLQSVLAVFLVLRMR